MIAPYKNLYSGFRAGSRPRLYVILMALAPFFTTAPAQEPSGDVEVPLHGPQDGYYEKAQYIVDSIVVVEEGKSMRFAPGSVIRFRRYGEFRVYGTLECIGAPSDMIVFTSDKHRPVTAGASRPAPFDWNGIVLEGPRASLRAAFMRVVYATTGIDVKGSRENVFLKNVFFGNNGTADFSCDGKNIIVSSGEPFAYPPETALSADDGSGARAGAALPQAENRDRRRIAVPMRIISAAITLGGGVMWAVSYGRAVALNEEYLEKGPGDADEWRDRRDAAEAFQRIGVAVTAAGAVGFGITFLF